MLFTFAAWKTVLTEFEISGPIPSPGIKETYTKLIKFSKKNLLRELLEMFG